MLEIPAPILDHAPWSVSKAGVIEKCSLQYDFKYGPHKQKEAVTSTESRLGIAVHAVYEMALGGTPIKKAFLHAGDQNELTHNELETLETFHNQVERFVVRMQAFRKAHKVRETFIEQRWAVSPTFTSTTFFDKNGLFRGVVDYALRTPSDLIIIDHKSGKENELSYYAAQFKAYCIMALARMPDLRGVQCAVNFAQADVLRWAPFVRADVIREEYHPWLIKYLSDCVSDRLTRPPEASQGWWCNWCGYKQLCPLFNDTRRGREEA